MKAESPPRFRDVEIDGVIYRLPAHDSFLQASEESAPMDPRRVPIAIVPSTLEWNDKKLSIGAQAGSMGELLSVETAALLKLEGVDPWPRFAIAWRHGGYRNDELFGAARGMEAALDERVTALADELGARRAQLVQRGWIGVAEVEWEQVASLPDEVPRTQGQGAFRTTGLARVPEPVVARRSPRTSTEALLAWLASGPDRPWRRQPIEIVVTDEHVYARAPAGVWRVPLASLRALIAGPGRDRLAIFGRRTQLLISYRPGCPLVEHLEARLGR